eukprot:TRINITY_DN50055_c0_g1_i1.p1 TRINITY_DN50055_c0_g1~~TRINITY_DN50055_c0_g1_i1.p1  ORF type:complete len:231 (+),score=51.32 TRINITY_DN50055_c0_g1_i1:43-693(+)
MSSAASSAGRVRGRPRSLLALGVCSLQLLLLGIWSSETNFVGARAPATHLQKRASVLVRHGLGSEVTNDSEMLQKLKEWKKTRPKGFAEKKKPSQETSPPPAAPPSPPPMPRVLSAYDAVGELVKRGPEADPSALSPQQLITVLFAFFAGWRQKNGIDGEIELSETQKQMVVLMVQSHLQMVNSAKDFWPSLCAELGSTRDPESKELLFTLAGVRQ